MKVWIVEWKPKGARHWMKSFPFLKYNKSRSPLRAAIACFDMKEFAEEHGKSFPDRVDVRVREVVIT